MSHLYLTLKLMHVIGATVLFGTGLGIAFFMFMANRTRDPGDDREHRAHGGDCRRRCSSRTAVVASAADRLEAHGGDDRRIRCFTSG